MPVDLPVTLYNIMMVNEVSTWGVEVKASATATAADGHGLRRLAEQSGPSFRGGMILYAGASTFAMADRRVFAVPLAALWAK